MTAGRRDQLASAILSHTWTPIAPGVEVWHNEGRVKSLGDGWFRVRRVTTDHPDVTQDGPRTPSEPP